MRGAGVAAVLVGGGTTRRGTKWVLLSSALGSHAPARPNKVLPLVCVRCKKAEAEQAFRLTSVREKKPRHLAWFIASQFYSPALTAMECVIPVCDVAHLVDLSYETWTTVLDRVTCVACMAEYVYRGKGRTDRLGVNSGVTRSGVVR